MNPTLKAPTEILNQNGKIVDYSKLGKKNIFYKLTHFNLKDPLTILVIAACLLPIIVIGAVYGDVLGEYLYLMTVPITFYLIIPVVFLASRGYHDATEMSFILFAQSNGWKVESAKGSPVVVPPSVSDQFKGSRHPKTAVAKVVLLDLSFDFAYVYLRDHQEEVLKTLTVARYRLPGQSSQIVLDNREISSFFTGFDSELVETILEGNFRQNFRLLHRKDEHIDALSVITPDVMLVSQQSQTKFEIEVNGNYLYLFSKFDHSDEKSTKDLFDAMVIIAPEIAHQVKSSQLPHDLLEKQV